jgi:hypothetical protein
VLKRSGRYEQVLGGGDYLLDGDACLRGVAHIAAGAGIRAGGTAWDRVGEHAKWAWKGSPRTRRAVGSRVGAAEGW